MSDGRVASVERVPAPGNGWQALPGFANAHVHLELSATRGEELPRATFAQWIEGLLERRPRSDAEIADAVRAGAADLLATGTVAVGDVDPTGIALAVLRSTPLDGVAYRELLGTPAEGVLAGLERELASQNVVAGAGAARGRGVRLGVSPHAPYTAGDALYRRAFDWSRRFGAGIASHVAETGEEEELLDHARGPLADLFARRGFAAARWSGAEAEVGDLPRGASAFDRIAALDPPAGFVVVHGNRLDQDEIELCAKRRWPIVYCPRSHRYFGRPRHPAARVLASGGTLALGTDSRASLEGPLDLWSEIACFRGTEAGVGDGAILAAATSGGRRALGLEPAELRPGDPATFQLARTRDGRRLAAGEFEPAASRGELRTAAVIVRGRVVVGNPGEAGDS